jgi:hypothetical protein
MITIVHQYLVSYFHISVALPFVLLSFRVNLTAAFCSSTLACIVFDNGTGFFA